MTVAHSAALLAAQEEGSEAARRALQDRACVALENEHGKGMLRLQRSHREFWDAVQASHAADLVGVERHVTDALT